MNAPTDWTSALVILGAGLALGALFVFFFTKRRSRVIGDDAAIARKDLEAKRDALLGRLRDLDETSSADERVRLEKETAAVLRQLDESGASSPAAVAAQEQRDRLSMNPTTRGFLWGAGSVAALAALFYFVMQAAEPRQEGGIATGSIPMQQQPQGVPQQANAMITQLEAAVRSDPGNLQLRNDLARAYLDTDNLMGVFEQTKVVLEKTPNDSRALTYQAFVRMNMGEAEAAESMLKQATQSDQKNLDAWVALAWLYVQQDKMKDAEAMIAEAAKQSPGDKAQLEAVFRQMQQQGNEPQQAQGGDLPPGHPPVGSGAPGAPPAAMTAAAPVAATSGEKSVTVTLDAEASARGKNGVLFIMARNPMGGPPLAVKRLPVAQFPVTFTFGQADSMMGQPFPDKFRLEVRLDSDGNAATKPPTDPTAMLNDVAPGTSVRLALK